MAKGWVKRFLPIYSLTAVCLFICFILIQPPVAANPSGGGRPVEFVILLDVSGSMGWRRLPGNDPRWLNLNDPEIIQPDGTPTRISTQAIERFVTLSHMNPNADVTLSLVIYNHNYYTAFERVNIRTDADVEFIKSRLNDVVTGNIGTSDGNIQGNSPNPRPPWDGGRTDMSVALLEAQRILNLSARGENVIEGVLLFTDGMLELMIPYTPRNVYDAAIDAAVRVCRDIVTEFRTEGVNFFAVGLNGGTDVAPFDEGFLRDLTAIHHKSPLIVNLGDGDNLITVIDYFNSIFQDLVGIPRSPEPPLVITYSGSKEIDVFGEITQAVSVLINNDKAMEYIKVFAPGNSTPVYDSQAGIATAGVVVHSSLNSTHITINDPSDGVWRVDVRGTERDTFISVEDIHFYNLDIRYTKSDDNVFEVFLFNNITNRRVSLPRIYETSEFMYSLVNTGDGRTVGGLAGMGQINSRRDGFSISLPPLPIGEYRLELKILKLGYFDNAVDIDVSVQEMALRLTADADLRAPVILGSSLVFNLEMLSDGGVPVAFDPSWRATIYVNGAAQPANLTGTRFSPISFNTAGSVTVRAVVSLGTFDITNEVVFEVGLPELRLTADIDTRQPILTGSSISFGVDAAGGAAVNPNWNLVLYINDTAQTVNFTGSRFSSMPFNTVGDFTAEVRLNIGAAETKSAPLRFSVRPPVNAAIIDKKGITFIMNAGDANNRVTEYQVVLADNIDVLRDIRNNRVNIHNTNVLSRILTHLEANPDNPRQVVYSIPKDEIMGHFDGLSYTDSNLFYMVREVYGGVEHFYMSEGSEILEIDGLIIWRAPFAVRMMRVLAVVLPIAAIAGAVLFAAFFFLVMKPRMKPNKRFKVTLSDGTGEYSANIPILKSVRGFDKTTINLWDIVRHHEWFRGVPDDFEAYCSTITITGKPFGNNNLVVKCIGKKKQTKVFTGKNNVRFVDDGKGSDKKYSVVVSQYEI